MRKRKRTFWAAVTALLFMVLTLVPQSVSAAAYWPEGIEIQSPSAVVMEMETGTILFEKNMDEEHYPASITKIMTAMIALEHGDLSDTVVFSKDAVYKTEGSGIARDVGEEMTLEQCMYAMLLESANECAYAIAEHVGGTYEAFVQMMNEKAAQLGCTHTHFNNPHGLPDEEHYTSAHDMALIARAAWGYETFRIMTGTVRYQIPPTNKHSEITYLQNHNAMINDYKGQGMLYEPCVGGKTGFTQAAKNTLVTYAQKDGLTLICVIMYTEAPLHWTETRDLFEYCFGNFVLMNVAEQEDRFGAGGTVPGRVNGNVPFVELDPEAQVVLPATASFADTETSLEEFLLGNVAGRITYRYGGRIVGEADVVATHPTAESFPFQSVIEGKEEADDGDGEETGRSWVIELTPRRVLIAAFILLGVILLAIVVIKALSRAYVLRQRFYRWKNGRSPYQQIGGKGFSMRKRRR